MDHLKVKSTGLPNAGVGHTGCPSVTRQDPETKPTSSPSVEGSSYGCLCATYATRLMKSYYQIGICICGIDVSSDCSAEMMVSSSSSSTPSSSSSSSPPPSSPPPSSASASPSPSPSPASASASAAPALATAPAPSPSSSTSLS